MTTWADDGPLKWSEIDIPGPWFGDFLCQAGRGTARTFRTLLLPADTAQLENEIGCRSETGEKIMALFTPRGLKVCLPVDYSFALMQRLYPTVDAFKVLQTTEGFELLPFTLGFMDAILCFLGHLGPVLTALVVAVAHVMGHCICINNLTAGVFFVRMSTILSVVNGYGIYFLVLGVVGFISAGWQGLAAYTVGRLLAGLVNGIINHFNEKRMQKEAGAVFAMSELNFFNAYLFYARRQKKSTDLAVTDAELEESSWQPVFQDLATKWPKIVTRFTPDK
jgi:hypothetical protein